MVVCGWGYPGYPEWLKKAYAGLSGGKEPFRELADAFRREEEDSNREIGRTASDPSERGKGIQGEGERGMRAGL
jgi:hypothetical protein